MSRADDLATVLANEGSVDGISYRQGTVIGWDVTQGTNQISIGGVIFENLPVYGRIEAMSIRPGDVVGLLKWRSQYMVLGLIGDPATAADVTIRQGTLTVDGGTIRLLGGDDLLVEDGDIKVVDADGNTSVRVGRTPLGGGQVSTYHPNGVPHMTAGQVHIESTGQVVGQGFFVQQDDGLDLIGAAPLEPGGPPLVRIQDPAGDLAFTTNSVGGWSMFAPGDPSGAVQHLSPSETDRRLMDKPYQDFPLYRNNTTGSVAYGGASFQAIHVGRMYVTHPKIHVTVSAWVSSGTGQIQLLVDGTQVGAASSVTNTSPGFKDFGTSGGATLPASVRSNVYGFVQVEVRARITAGSGNVFVLMNGCTRRGN